MILEAFYSFVTSLSISAKAGLVMKTPIVMPKIVVNAKPLSNPVPAHHKGIKAIAVVA